MIDFDGLSQDTIREYELMKKREDLRSEIRFIPIAALILTVATAAANIGFQFRPLWILVLSVACIGACLVIMARAWWVRRKQLIQVVSELVSHRVNKSSRSLTG